jgi:cyclohexanone monooxygenase
MADPDYDAIVVGAGFAGIYMLHRLREQGFSARVFESAPGIGGTWWHNAYPGLRCDIASVEYSYSFSEALEQEWHWTERYPTQPEVQRYLAHVVDRFGLHDGIQLNTKVTAATYDEATRLWTINTDTGQTVTARYFITAVGCLSAANLPAFPGIEKFAGRVLHTGAWPQESVDFSGLRVGVIGTGSSGVQVIPIIAEQAEHLTVFQRTAHYVVPARNHALSTEYLAEVKAGYREYRERVRRSALGFDNEGRMQSALEATPEQREAEYQRRWDRGGPFLLGAYGDLFFDLEANKSCSEFVRRKIEEVVADPAMAEKLKPRFPIGAKRLCQGTNYYETYNRQNVTLVDIRENPIAEVLPEGIRLADGTMHPLDLLVLATGYDAVTGTLLRIDIRGAGGKRLCDVWADGPRTYLGVAVNGFPNMFIITGPGSPSITSNVVLSIEQHVDWIADCLVHLRAQRIDHIEPLPDAQDTWTAECAAIANRTIMTTTDSWYFGANVPGKPRVFLAYLGGVGPYRDRCDAVAAAGYQGFALQGRQTQ